MFTEPLSKFLNYEKPIPNCLLIVMLVAFYMAMDSLNGEKFVCTFDFGALFQTQMQNENNLYRLLGASAFDEQGNLCSAIYFWTMTFYSYAHTMQPNHALYFPFIVYVCGIFLHWWRQAKNDKSHCFRILIILSRFGNRKEWNEKRENLNTWCMHGYFGPKKCVTLRLLNRSRRQFPMKTMLLFSFHSMRYFHWTGLFFCFK